MQLRTRDSPGQDKYGSATIADSEHGSVGFPPTNRNTLAEGVSHCEAYIYIYIYISDVGLGRWQKAFMRSRFAMTAAVIAPASWRAGGNAE